MSLTEEKTARSLALKPGQVIDGRFEVLSEIGAGGQGQVFRVRHLEWNQDFALKVPLPECVDSPDARERFLKEAQTWIRMGVHPNIVRCWFVRPVVNRPALFLDLIGGGSLETHLENRTVAPGDWERVLYTLLQIAEGLTHSHAKGVVHRDLKPENLLMRENGQLCITDFGLVKTLSEGELSGSSIPEGPMGTPRYGAPEQWTDPDSIGTATDIYALGTIMYEVICGRRPFEPPGTELDSISLINKHIIEEPPDPHSVREDIPVPLAQLCLRCMEKDPADRPDSALAVLEQLNKIYLAITGRSYGRPSPIPAGDRPALLNNAAASLYSLGQPEKARELLLKGLMLEAGHPECLYNLTQIDRREGKIGRRESFRRLRRARAVFQLGLLYLEAGMGDKAADSLKRLEDEARTGYVIRTEGDALMYAGEFSSAQAAYEKAEELMPNDRPTKFRKMLAERRTRRWDGRLYFPKLTSCYSSSARGEGAVALLTSDGRGVVGVSPTEIVHLDTETGTVIANERRPETATATTATWISESDLLLQDRGGFEVWSLNPLRRLDSTEGRVLCATSDLKRFVVLTNRGVLYRESESRGEADLQFPPDVKPSRQVFASFDPVGNGLGLLVPDGRIATVNGTSVIPLEWPSPLPDPARVTNFLLGNRTVTIATSGGRLECMDLKQKKARFRFELGFSPDSLHHDRDGQALVASSSLAFTIVDSNGALLLRGRGPCSLDASRRLALVWLNGVLCLYQLSPFQLIRIWEEKVSQPVALHFCRTGTHALSLSEDRQYRVWEVDEFHRVYERNLLVTPGESYEQLIQSFQNYLSFFEQALERFRQNRFNRSYEALINARAVPGFGQAEEALELQWALCAQLKREGLEAIWERLYLSDALAAELSGDGTILLLAKKDQAQLYKISGPTITPMVALQGRERLLSATYLTETTGPPAVVTVSSRGCIEYHHGETGEQLLVQDLEVGPINYAGFTSHLSLLHSESGELLSVDLHQAKIISRSPLEGRKFESAFPLSQQRFLVVTDRELLLQDLRKPGLRPWLPLKLDRLPGSITFVRDEEECQLRLTGFSDGTLLVSRLKDGQPLFGINHENGPVTGAAINITAAVGITVSAHGGLTIFGLDSGRILERFTAHNSRIAHLSLTDNGRYFTTLSADGQFRLWELSWSLGSEAGSREIEWLPNSSGSRLGGLFRRL